jgi:hypothetical protein
VLEEASQATFARQVGDWPSSTFTWRAGEHPDLRRAAALGVSTETPVRIPDRYPKTAISGEEKGNIPSIFTKAISTYITARKAPHPENCNGDLDDFVQLRCDLPPPPIEVWGCLAWRGLPLRMLAAAGAGQLVMIEETKPASICMARCFLSSPQSK